jgi:hypothetical protein
MLAGKALSIVDPSPMLPITLLRQAALLQQAVSAAAQAAHLMRLPPSPLNQAQIAARCCLMCCLSAGLSNLQHTNSNHRTSSCGLTTNAHKSDTTELCQSAQVGTSPAACAPETAQQWRRRLQGILLICLKRMVQQWV